MTHTYTHTHTHIYTHIHIHTHTYTHIHTHIHAHTHTYTHTHIHSHTYTHTELVDLLWRSDQWSTWQHTTLQETDIHALGGIQTRIPSKRTAADPHLKPWGPPRSDKYILWDLFVARQTKLGLSRLIVEVSRSHTNTHTQYDSCGRMTGRSQGLLPAGYTKRKIPEANIHALGGIPTHDPSSLVAADLHIWSHGQRNLLVKRLSYQYIIYWGFSTNDLFCNSLNGKFAATVVVRY